MKVAEAALGIIACVYCVGVLIELQQGKRTVRDAHGRLKPAPALLVMAAPLVVLGAVMAFAAD